jgi:hypothetical protein
MSRTLVVLFLLAVVSLSGACSTASTTNENTAPKNGVVETNANVNNLNANTAPSNVGVVTNNNGNKNTAGVSPINANANSNQNGKSKTGKGNN